jgi:hypothetical protein
MSAPKGKVSPTVRARRLVAGVAWTVLLLSAWFCLRLLLLLLLGERLQIDPGGLGATFFGEAGGSILVVHAVWAALTAVAALALLKFKVWAHRYFVAFFFVAALEFVGLACIWLSSPVDNLQFRGMHLAAAVIFGLLGAMAGMLGWKFLSDKEIRSLFKKN